MKKKLRSCKSCGQEIAKSARFCPKCGAKNKKPIFKKWWFWVLVVVLFITIGASGNDTDVESTKNNTPSSNHSISSESQTEKVTEAIKTEYYVGDILNDGNTKIVFISSGDYVEENEFAQPNEGNKYIFLEFAFENTSRSSDAGVSYYDFECYADGYAVDMYYGGNEDLSATLSAGRATTGSIYFEVPIEAKIIEVEYETNIFTEDKIKFIFEGEKDSGYVQEPNTTRTEGAYAVGNLAESSNLKITYLSCEEYISNNMFIVPANGNRFISCEFEFENIGSSDEFVSSFDFDCYADGLDCKPTFIRDDDLSATLSTGRKAKGTVTFEVPIDAEVIEVEYLSNYWTSNRVVFTVK